MKRSKHSLSHYKLATLDMGELVPVGCYEVLPGDTVQQATSLLLRVSPLLAPVMHPVMVRIHHWFVPNRIVWEDFEDFITGGSDGISAAAVHPTINPAAGFASGSLGDYFGIPTGVTNPGNGVSALPFRSYAKIFNEFYRDEDLVAEATVSVASGVDTTTSVALKKVAWEKDYFTSARAWPQKGPAVTLPLGTRAPVLGILGNQSLPTTYNMASILTRNSLGQQATIAINTSADVGASQAFVIQQGTGSPVPVGYPDIYADLSTATAVNIRDVREAFALQRYQEARAQYGSRYTEYLRYLGVRSSDARLQRPEYLGGGKQVISFSEILQTGVTTSGTPNLGVGELKGHGISAMRSGRFRRFFEEHGHVITLLSVRPRTMYMDGLHRMWNRRTKEDYWQRELERIGQQEIYEKEIFCEASAASDTVWGYQDRYSEYRHLPSQVVGDFRSTLNFWHYARDFTSSSIPVLNSSFVECDATKRVNAVSTNDVLWCMVNHNIQARRQVGKQTIGKVS